MTTPDCATWEEANPTEPTVADEASIVPTVNVDSYTVTHGATQVAITREKRRLGDEKNQWRLGDGGTADHWGPLFDDDELEVMMEVAVEYAKRVDASRKAIAAATAAEKDTHEWVQTEVERRRNERLQVAE